MWIRAKLRGQLVYARCDEAGKLVEKGGRVEIRYRTDDGRMYQAAARNLTVADKTVLPDDTCTAAEPVSGKSTKKKMPVSGVDAEVIAYTDGACSGNPGPAGLGVVLLTPAVRVERAEYLGIATNNVAELTAILRALEEMAARDECVGRDAVIHTDSQYAIGVLQKGWKAKKNVELVADLKRAIAAHGRCRLVYVPGHAGVPLNERADELARQAVAAAGDARTVVPREVERSNVAST